jgi:predicted metal-dependent peptidase
MTTNTTAAPRNRNDSLDKLIGPTDSRVDHEAREKLITARIGMLIRAPFFGNLATRLKLVNADEWCSTAATDGRNLYYNSRFINMLRVKELEFLVGHELLHVIYDHLGRRENRDRRIWNIANDFAVNADLKEHRIGEMITTVPCLYDPSYHGMTSEQIYDILMQNAKKIDIDGLFKALIDDHLEGQDDNKKNENDDKENDNRPKFTKKEMEEIRQEFLQEVIAAAQQAKDQGDIPLGVRRIIQQLTEPVMPWRELIQTNLTSATKNDYSWMRPSRRSWHMDAIMPGMIPGEKIDVVVMIDMSGSISQAEGMHFLSEVAGMMDAFDEYKLKVGTFDTKVYNVQEFTSENMESIEEYELKGGGGTDFGCIYEYLKEVGEVPTRLIVFTDGYCNNWGDPDYCDTTWIIHDSDKIVPPHGTWAYYNDYQK